MGKFWRDALEFLSMCCVAPLVIITFEELAPLYLSLGLLGGGVSQYFFGTFFWDTVLTLFSISTFSSVVIFINNKHLA